MNLALAAALATIVGVTSIQPPPGWAPVYLPPDTRPTGPMIVRINKCTLTFRLKPGMTNQEANGAIDDGYERFSKCLKGAISGTGQPRIEKVN